MDAETPQWVDALRNQLPVLRRFNYLNSGTSGPICMPSSEAIAAAAEEELWASRGNFADWDSLVAFMEHTREHAARVLGADADEIAMTHHTGDGINVVLWGMDWQPGDQIITTAQEHGAVTVPLGILRERRGIQISFVDVGEAEQVLEAVQQALGARTRLVVLSHVEYATGALLPVERLIRLCHDARVPVLLDGAQTCGAMPVDVHALDVDYYTLSGQKWLCGPEGTGALYVKRRCLEDLSCTFGSYLSAQHDYGANIIPHEGARRFETGIFYRPGWAGFQASVRWILDEVRPERAWPRSLALAGRARTLLGALDGVRILTPADAASHLLSFTLPAFSPSETSALSLVLAREHRIIIRATMQQPRALRASFGFFNTVAEVDQLVSAIEAAVVAGPAALAEREP